MKPPAALLRVALAAVAVAVLTSCGGVDTGREAPASTTTQPLLSGTQLQAALLTPRTVGPSYVVQAAGARAPGSMGCLDALDPALLGADGDGPREVARVEYDTASTLPSSSVASVVVTFGSDRAVEQALDAFSVAAGGCTAVSEVDGDVEVELEVSSRLVPPKAPVQRELLVEGRGSIGNRVTAPAVGISVKVGRIGRQLVAVETMGIGGYGPDITPFYNVARARLVDVLAGDDPGTGRPVRG